MSNHLASTFSVLLCAVLSASCTLETNSAVDVPNAGERDAGVVVLGDTGVRSDGATAELDVASGRPDVPTPSRCTNNMQCDDRVDCTIDECNFGNGTCLHRADLNRCECDPGCHSEGSGVGGRMFGESGRMGVDYDMASGGLIVRANARMADYLWIPNTNESTLSKWDATTATELGRYRVGLPAGECVGRCCHENGCNMPSRTVIDGAGDAFVASRGFSMQGSVTKVAAERRDCVDRNMNGMIDTSTGPMDVRAFGQDECVLWTAEVGPPGVLLRSLGIDKGDEMNPQGTPWVGACGDLNSNANGGLWQLNTRTGAVVRAVPFGACAYGAVATPNGTLWEHSVYNAITPLNTVTGVAGAAVRVPVAMRGGCTFSYGITADIRGRIWLSGRGCRDVIGYDPALAQWTRVDLSAHIPAGGASGLGITVDPSNRVWVPISTAADWQGPTRVAYFDADAFVGGGNVAPASVTALTPTIPHENPTAIGADRAGNIWIASAAAGGQLLRYEPMRDRWQGFSGPNRVYTYTDFTGGVRRLVIGTGTYNETYNTGCMPNFADFRWTASTPPGTSLNFVLRTALTEAGLGAATPVPLAIAPRDMAPIDVTGRLLAAGVTPGQYARVTVTFNTTNFPVQTPVLQSLNLSWRCPVDPG